MKLLIIEDETELAHNIASYLSEENYLCELANNYETAHQKIELYSYDCILLDISLPGGDGLDLLKLLRFHKKEDGVIVISAKDSIEDKIYALQFGADDYLAKPFHLSELAARIFAVIRRKSFSNSNTISFNELNIDILAKTVKVNEHLILLTKKEFDLLLLFIGNKNRVLSKSALAEHLSGDFADMFDNHDFVYAHVKNLKKKLSEAGAGNYLKTIYGSGYKWQI